MEKASNYDELFMQQSLHFADSLKDLKNIRNQLYTAAEYFEASYCKKDQQQLVVETLRDYLNQAVVSTVDHLGSVAYKLSSFLDQKVDEASGSQLRFFSIEQRLRTYQEFTGFVGLSHNSLLEKYPKYHKQYSLPGISKNATIYSNSSPYAEHDSHQCRNERRSISPHRFTLKRSGSQASQSNTPNFPNARQQYPSEPPRQNMTKEIQKYSKRSQPFFKALLGMRKQKTDGRLYR